MAPSWAPFLLGFKIGWDPYASFMNLARNSSCDLGARQDREKRMFLFRQEVSAIAMPILKSGTLLVLAAGGAALSLVLFLKLVRMDRGRPFQQELQVDYLGNSLVIMPLDRWSSITKKGLHLAVHLKGHIRVVHVANASGREEFDALWQRNVVTPLREADRVVPELVVLPSSSGQILQPIAEYILRTERLERDRQIIVVVTQLEVAHWWQRPLHNHRSRLLKIILSIFGGQRILIVDVPWRL